MDISGLYQIPATRELVWELLNDESVLQQCIPGCEELTSTQDNQYAAKVVLKIGPVKAKFEGEVLLSDHVYPESFKISGEGKGGIAGFANGSADVELSEIDSGTELSYIVDVNIGGKIAQLGSRLIASTSKKLADKFFSEFTKIASEKALAVA